MFDPVVYAAMIADVDAATTPRRKGSTLEALCAYLFNAVAGVEVVDRDVSLPAEEIDLVVWNAQIHDMLRVLDPVIFVECKNWSVSVGAPMLDSFIGKLRRRSLKSGVFIAAGGVTGTYDRNGARGARGIIASALQEGYRVITLTMADLRLITSCDDFTNLLKARYCRIYLNKLL